MASALPPILAVAALAVVALAGCSGGGDPDGGAGGPAGGEDDEGAVAPTDSIAAPATWAVGDAWTYAFDGAEATYVVTQDGGSDWILGTDSEERAFSDLREDVSRLGPQRKSDLAGSQGEDRVEFFRWPLEPGKTWTTRWDQLQVAIEVRDVRDGVATLWALDAEGEAGRIYEYTYDAEAGWFGELRRYAPDGGMEADLRLTRSTHNWTGTLVRWELTTVLEEEEEAQPFPLTRGGPFEVPAGTTDIWTEYHFTCTGSGGYGVFIEPANPGLAGSQGHHGNGPCTQVDFAGVAVAAPHPGTWTFGVTAGGETVASHYAFLLRTRQDVPFGGS